MARSSKEKTKQYQKEWYKRNKHKFVKKWAAQKAKEKENPEIGEIRRAKNRAYYHEHKENILAKLKKQRDTSPSYLLKIRDLRHKHQRPDQKLFTKKITEKELQEIFLRDQKRQIEKIKSYKTISEEEKERRIHKIYFPNSSST